MISPLTEPNAAIHDETCCANSNALCIRLLRFSSLLSADCAKYPFAYRSNTFFKALNDFRTSFLLFSHRLSASNRSAKWRASTMCCCLLAFSPIGHRDSPPCRAASCARVSSIIIRGITMHMLVVMSAGSRGTSSVSEEMSLLFRCRFPSKS